MQILTKPLGLPGKRVGWKDELVNEWCWLGAALDGASRKCTSCISAGPTAGENVHAAVTL